LPLHAAEPRGGFTPPIIAQRLVASSACTGAPPIIAHQLAAVSSRSGASRILKHRLAIDYRGKCTARSVAGSAGKPAARLGR